MRKLTLWNALAVIALGGLLALPLAFAGTQRSDCPGKVVCPLTGEEICKDQCPLAAKKTGTTRAECPGQIECPLTGDVVCRDQCPVADLTTKEEAGLSDCCRQKK
jgi:hypothetical protein